MSTDNTSQEISRHRQPRHVAIIMDGNGRWAEKRHRPRIFGHRAGVEAVRDIVRACAEKSIEVLTIFAFSSENWRRPQKEVSLLMELLSTALQREVKKLHENRVRLQIIGDRTVFPDELRQRIDDSEQLTAANDGLRLVVAINYGGRWDITQAARRIAGEVASGAVAVDEITEEAVAARLSMPDLPEPDLFIRTGGEQRISNFLIWHLAYTELYFTDTLWPDFDRQAFELALQSFAARQRRFGRTGEQVAQADRA